MNKKLKLSKSKKIILSIIVLIFFVNLIKTWNLGESSQNRTTISISQIKDNNLILVNKTSAVGEDYKPENLVKPNITFLDSSTNEEKYLQKEAANALEELFQGAKNQDITLIGSSGYRSYQTQVNIYNKYLRIKGKEYTEKYVAKPGTSEHQTGLAMDVTNPTRYFDKTSKEAEWLADNAYKYGFILRYLEDKTDITGYNYEPWHIRYVGKEVAKIIYENNETLEEYLNKN